VFSEHLRFRVAPDQTKAFEAHNRRWRAALVRQDGFLGQETYRHADEAKVWLVVVRWRDRAAMEAFPDAVQEELDATGYSISTLIQTDHFEEVGA
jgi:quinol monooxygenase YgiN